MYRFWPQSWSQEPLSALIRLTPLLKLWVDEVFAFRWAYGPGGRALVGKDLWLVTSTGGDAPVLVIHYGANDAGKAGATAFGIEYCTQQIEELIRGGAPGVHFYTLNKAHSTVQILKNLGHA